jgi:phosphohistidine phosphatase
MELFLVQHAEAKSKEKDPERSLTKKGRRNAEAVAASAAKLGLELAQIRHSGKRRAEQTAMILAEKLNPHKGVVAASGLGPLDEVEPVAAELTELGESVMLVGHLPFMERLTGQLVVGDPERPVVSFRNAGIVCLTRDGEHWQVAWILTPEIARA